MSSSSSTIIVSVDLGELSLLETVSSADKTFADVTNNPISVHISGLNHDNPLASALEGVALQSVIGILRHDVDRIDDLTIETECKSPLRGVREKVRG